MTAGDFESKNALRWREYEALVISLEKGRPVPGVEELPRRFRELCVDLSLARSRMYGAGLVERLNGLVIRGYHLIYRQKRGGWQSVMRMAAVTFPQTVRREWRLFTVCSLLFWGPFFALLIAARYDFTWIQAILGSDGMAAMDQMYGKQSNLLSHLRSQYGSDFMMFCFYIWNNVSIDFRIFAGGMTAGVATIFYTFYNGLHIGASAGYVSVMGDPTAFWSFVAGHSSFELTGMVIAGMAGLRVGSAILRPGRLPRGRALAAAGRESLPLLYGAGVMTAMAAVIEGFWSAKPFAPELKYAVGIGFWLLHVAYFVFAGRRGADAA